MEEDKGTEANFIDSRTDEERANAPEMVLTASTQSDELMVIEQPKKEEIVELKDEDKKEVLEVIKDNAFPPFTLYKTFNAWWGDSLKVRALITAFKIGANIKQARSYAGISRNQWEYFIKLYPEFYGVIEGCENLTDLKALNTLANKLDSDPDIAMKWLQHRDKRFGAKVEEKPEENTGNITNQTNIVVATNEQIEAILARSLGTIKAHGEPRTVPSVPAGDNQPVEERDSQ